MFFARISMSSAEAPMSRVWEEKQQTGSLPLGDLVCLCLLGQLLHVLVLANFDVFVGNDVPAQIAECNTGNEQRPACTLHKGRDYSKPTKAMNAP